MERGPERTVVPMTSTRVSVIASSAAVALWACKSVAIGTAGGLGESPAEGPFFFAGLLAAVVASAALGVSLLADRGRAARVAGGVLGPVLGMAGGAAVDAVVGVFQPVTEDRPWVWSELSLWVLAVALLAAALAHRSRSRVDAERPGPAPVVVPAG